jgi:hypothetical protein
MVKSIAHGLALSHHPSPPETWGRDTAYDPLAWLTDVLTKLVNVWPASRIEELMPWAYAKKPA